MSPAAALRLFVPLCCLLAPGLAGAAEPAARQDHRIEVKGPPLKPSVTTLVDSYRQACRTYGRRPLFLTKKGPRGKYRKAVTYRKFAKLVDGFRGGLEDLGVGPKDRVAIIADNGVEWAVSAYATYGRGAAFVPMYLKQSVEDWTHILSNSEAKVVIVPDAQTERTIQKLRGKLPNLKQVIRLDGEGEYSYNTMVRGEAGELIRPEGKDTAGLIYTSGTSGKPKGVVLSHDNVASSISAIHQLFPDIGPKDRSLAILPWAHAMGQNCELHGLLSVGAQIAINELPSEATQAERLRAFGQNLKKARPTLLVAVPKLFKGFYDKIVDPEPLEVPALDRIAARIPKRLRRGWMPSALLNLGVNKLFSSALTAVRKRANGEKITLSQWLSMKTVRFLVRKKLGGRLRMAVSGSAVLEPRVAEVINGLIADVYEGYGMTETSPLVAVHRPGDRVLGTVGKPVPGVEVKLDTSHEAANSEIGEGEVLVRGPNVMQGYFGQPEETAKVKIANRWLRTGDLGILDRDGNLKITGRVNEQYKLDNGEKVIPSPIEAKLSDSALIEQALVWGENKPYNTALIVPNRNALRNHNAEEQRKLIAKAIEATNGRLDKGYERIKGFVILDEKQEISIDNGLLTPVGKLKRPAVLKAYGHLLEALYEAK